MAKRVLVIDDEEDVRDFVRMVLEAGGYAVEVAADGMEGLAAIDSQQPDLVVLDLMMPVMDGWQVLAEVGPRRPPTIIVLSAAADPDRALNQGAAAVMAKPFRAQELLATCRRILGE